MNLLNCSDLCEEWDEYIFNKNLFAFDEFAFSYDEFADLVKRTYNYLKNVNMQYELSAYELYKLNPNLMFEYAELASLIRAFATTENCMDYPEEYLTTMIIAKRLSEKFTYHQYKDMLNGVIEILPLRDETYKLFLVTYDIEKGDFSDIIENVGVLSDIVIF